MCALTSFTFDATYVFNHIEVRCSMVSFAQSCADVLTILQCYSLKICLTPLHTLTVKKKKSTNIYDISVLFVTSFTTH